MKLKCWQVNRLTRKVSNKKFEVVSDFLPLYKKAAPFNRAATFTLLLQAKIDQWLNNHSRYFNNNNPLYKVAGILIFAYYFTMNKQYPYFRGRHAGINLG